MFSSLFSIFYPELAKPIREEKFFRFAISETPLGIPKFSDLPVEFRYTDSIPDTYDVLAYALKQLNIFVSYEKTSPYDANIIIRCFQKRHDVRDEYIINAFGFEIYVKGPFGFYTILNGKKRKISFKNHIRGTFIYPDECITVQYDTSDFYYKITKK